MRNDLLAALLQFTQQQKNNVKKGFRTNEFAIILIETYAKSMIRGLHIIHREADIEAVKSESEQLCRTLNANYQWPLLRTVKIPPSVVRAVELQPLKFHSEQSDIEPTEYYSK